LATALPPKVPKQARTHKFYAAAAALTMAAFADVLTAEQGAVTEP